MHGHNDQRTETHSRTPWGLGIYIIYSLFLAHSEVLDTSLILNKAFEYNLIKQLIISHSFLLWQWKLHIIVLVSSIAC